MFSAVFSPLNSWCVLVPWHDGVNFWSLGLFLGGRGWSGFGVWGLRKWGVMEVKKLGRSFQSVSWFERGGRHCFLLGIMSFVGISFYYWRFWWNGPGCRSDVTSWISWRLNFACHMPASGRQKTWSNSCALNSPGIKTTTWICPFVTKGGLVPLWFHAHHYDDLGHLVPGLQLRWSAQVLRCQTVKCWRFAQLTKFWSWKNQVVGRIPVRTFLENRIRISNIQYSYYGSLPNSQIFLAAALNQTKWYTTYVYLKTDNISRYTDIHVYYIWKLCKFPNLLSKFEMSFMLLAQTFVSRSSCFGVISQLVRCKPGQLWYCGSWKRT